jgi:hypothetical protein
MKKQTECFTVVGKFRDANIPNWNVRCNSIEQAEMELDHLSKTIAGLSLLAIFTREGAKQCYDRMGNYIFTIMADDCKNLGLKP